MKVRKAVITAAAPKQRRLPLQNVIDRNGNERSVLGILIEEAARAKVEEIAVVVAPGDEGVFAEVAGEHAARVRFIVQPQPLGYAHAVYCTREFVAQDPFLHMVGDHVYVSRGEDGCAAELVRVAEAEDCSISAVQPTRESLLARFGAVGGQRLPGRPDLYRIQTVIEKPTPTEAEQRLIVSGLRAGYYLCFFGMHVLTPAVMTILEQRPRAGSLSEALEELARREQYLALQVASRRYDLGSRYGVLTAQLAMALSGRYRDEVLSELLELLAMREMGAARA